MNKKAKQKQIGNYFTLHFLLLSFSCLVVIVILSFIILKLNSSEGITGDLGDAIKWISDRVIFLAPLLGVICIFIILMIQRRQMIRYISTLSAIFESINLEQKPNYQLPTILRDVEESIQRIQLEWKEKERVARDAEQRKNDLIVYLAHDLKTPISSIIGYLTLLRDEKNISEEMHHKFTHIAMNNAERLDDLINEFFEITRFNLSNVSLNYSKVNIPMMLEQLLFEFQPSMNTKNLTYRLEGNKDVQVVCDAEKIQRVFDNLLSNAVHYSIENSEILISMKEEADNLVIQFHNECYAVDQENLNRIFEQFYRLDSSRSTRNGGTGLGLAIAKQIMEQHNGTVIATSEGNNITFTVKLPLL